MMARVFGWALLIALCFAFPPLFFVLLAIVALALITS